ncbi:MAG: signal recognition particle-docking protein FtsY [Ignavibacteria bacterium]
MSILDKIGFTKLKEGLSKTKDSLIQRIGSLVSIRKIIDENFLAELEEIFILSDMGYNTAQQVIENIKSKAKTEKFESENELKNFVVQEIKNIFLKATEVFGSFSLSHNQKPYVIMIVGVNGVGKTTSIGKLAYNFKNAGKSVLIGSADTFRAAANEQLEIWAQRAGVDIIQNPNSKDPASVAFDTVKAAIARNMDNVIIDTAGRLHNKSHLMEELKKIKRVVQKVIPDAPHEIFIVIDATTGQNGLNQVIEFKNALGNITGIILTKLDGTAKGGIVVKICKELSIPVRFVGVGEKIDDLQVFDPEAFANALFEN